ncbi:twin-arginine translocase TatA/TatE family subunit [Methylopila sp. M107]|uniref:twin-arginine translocase TatA/TatE family subunit n=1 Tax=Methylopila sp. M107 TaxID=1101190 RepID=UPI00037CF9B5|nr:twin-arginine translocase TatA/TatE family subunit [Methylopila sp. M107]
MSLSHWLIVAVLVMLLFGRGKISELMGDMAKGIKSFKKGMAEDDDVAEGMSQQRGPQTLEHRADQPVRPNVGSVDSQKS